MVEIRANHEVENAAIEHVLGLELAAGRKAFDMRRQLGGSTDIEGDRLIEVKAYGMSARGQGLWLETRQVELAESEPDRFHLVIVENVRQGDTALFRVLDLHGEQLRALLQRKREKRYYEVPFPVAVHDALTEQAQAPRST